MCQIQATDVPGLDGTRTGLGHHESLQPTIAQRRQSGVRPVRIRPGCLKDSFDSYLSPATVPALPDVPPAAPGASF